MKMRFAPATLAALLALFSTASADVQIADTGYQETKAGKALSLRRVFTIDTGKKTFVLQSNGVSIGYVNSSWHQNEVCAVDVNGEKFFEFTDIASARNEFQDRIAFTVTPGKESGTIAAAWEGQRAKVTLAYAARANDDKLEITVKVTPKQTLWATTVAFECYPSAGGPRHKLSRAVATAKRAEVLPPWEDEKRVDLARDERWALFYDNQIDLGTPVVADQKGRGGCALVYAPEDATEAWIKVGAVHIDSRFRYGPDVTEMRFAVLDFQNEKSNAAGLAYMKTLEETGYRIAGTRPARPAAAAKAPVAPAPVVERRPYPLLPGGALPLVTDGNSAYSIHHSPAAPTSVRAAAKELQRVIAIATGATLPVRTEPVAPMICVGDGPASQAAGISGEDLPYGSYRVRTVGENLYIVGRDLPDGERTPFSGVSLGTRFGVSAFLERVVGARWIMPGDIGEEIPRRQTLAVAPIDLYEAPAFDYRTLTITDAPIVREWALRQKVSTASGGGNYASSFIVMANHSWDEFMPKGLRDAHPEWDAVDGEINKFCTRRPEAIRAFAENAVLWLKRNPNARMVQVSPSDGQIFCRCAQCRRFTVKDPHGQESVTLNILDSYNDVARVVAQERPGCMVGGFAYGLCTYPPAVPVALEPNVLIQWTPLNYYGMGLYKPAYRDEFERVAAQWRALTPNVTYWNYCHWHRSESGAPYAPALPIMKLQFPVLKKYGYRGVTEDGSANWCYGGPNNYLLAKLLWDANADVDALYREWLALAYGEGADAMGRLYAVLDEGFRDFKVNRESFHYHGDNYEIMPDKIEAIYVPRMARIEALYLEALGAAKSARARQRIELFGANLVVFHYNLRKAGYLADPEKSAFYRSDKAFDEFMQQPLPDSLGAGVEFYRRPLQNSKPLQPKARKSDFVAEKRTLDVPRRATQTAVVLDGRIDPGEWKTAATASGFCKLGTRTPAERQTTVRVMYDQETLYVAVECDEPRMADAPAPSLPNDNDRLFQGNVVELFLNAAGGADRVWHLAVNPANSRWDGIGNRKTEDLAWQSAAARSDGKWTAELAIPFAGLGLRNPAGATCRANVTRSRVLRDVREDSTWTPLEKAFLEPDHLGEWRFAAP